MSAAGKRCAKPRSGAGSSRGKKLATLLVWECKNCGRDVIQRRSDGKWIHRSSLYYKCPLVAEPADETKTKVAIEKDALERLYGHAEYTRMTTA